MTSQSAELVSNERTLQHVYSCGSWCTRCAFCIIKISCCHFLEMLQDNRSLRHAVSECTFGGQSRCRPASDIRYVRPACFDLTAKLRRLHLAGGRSTSDRLVPCHIAVAVKRGHEPSVWTLGCKLDDDEQSEDRVGPSCPDLPGT